MRLALISVAVLVLNASVNGQRPLAQAITGVAVDATGAVLPNADVRLTTTAGAAVQQTTTDAAGNFRFELVPQGRYEVHVAYEGFEPTTARVTVGARAPGPLRITLPLASVKQEVTVTNAAEVNATAAANSDAVTVDSSLLASLPVFDQDLVGTISRFLDAGALGNAGPTVVVNGMEVSALRVSASAVQQIKINQDPYSAEYARPGRGRIEILTKPGSADYHGEGNLFFRDAALDARNAFATSKPQDRKHILEGSLGGPVTGSGKASFFLSGHDQVEDQQAFVFAVGVAGTIQEFAPQPNRQSLASASITHQVSTETTISIRPNIEYESSENRGVGGTTLATAGTNFQHMEEQVTYTQQTLIHPTLLAQFQILVGHEREPTVSVSPDPGIVVAGAFTGGGAQGNLTRTETHMQATASLAWTKGRHLVQTGLQVPDWSRRGFEDRTNVGGTFYFADLPSYAAGLPYAFIQQQGNGNLAFLEKQIGAYIKDDFQWKPGVTLSYGVRYDWQNYFHDTNNVAPRASIAYAPGTNKTNVLRAGAGVFNDRSGPVAIADLLHYQPGGLVKTVIENPAYPNPFVTATAAVQPPSIVQLASDVQIPQTLQWSAGVDHQLAKATTLSVTYTGSHGFNLFRSRDVNAPAPPLYLARPDPSLGVVREIESNGRQESDSLSVTIRGRMTKWFNGQAQYALSRAYNDTNGIAWFPADDYDLTGEYARADFDRRHRLVLLGRLTPRKIADIGLGLTMNSAGPYTELLGQDIFNNGRGRARPAGVARNTLEGAGFASLDLRVARDLSLRKHAGEDRALTLGLDVFNLTNQVNYGSFVGTIGSPL
ncbi:MAG TPA: TonB-dependent receptor, partial [Vicinamibacterales bacterium]|nr:TonB-dependent receptor [Vicinamibacterales bacterium]